jgi:guanylate kinase
MRDLGKPYHYTVTTTTRTIRKNEVDGKDYIFVTKSAFQQMLDDDGLLEHAEVYGNHYGVPKVQVEQALAQGKDVILKIDVQGATTVREIEPDAVFIFMAAPTVDELEQRLFQRMTESQEGLRLRLRTAEAEMQESAKFDYVVINHDGRIDDTIQEIERAIDEERRRRSGSESIGPKNQNSLSFRGPTRNLESSR